MDFFMFKLSNHQMLCSERIVRINGTHLLLIPGWSEYTLYAHPGNILLLAPFAFTPLNLAAGNALDFPFYCLKCAVHLNCSGDFI